MSSKPITLSPELLKPISLPFLVFRMQKYHHADWLVPYNSLPPTECHPHPFRVIPPTFGVPYFNSMTQMNPCWTFSRSWCWSRFPLSKWIHFVHFWRHTFWVEMSFAKALHFIWFRNWLSHSTSVANRLYVLSFSSSDKRPTLHEDGKISYKYLKDLLLDDSISELFFKNVSLSIANSSFRRQWQWFPDRHEGFVCYFAQEDASCSHKGFKGGNRFDVWIEDMSGGHFEPSQLFKWTPCDPILCGDPVQWSVWKGERSRHGGVQKTHHTLLPWIFAHIFEIVRSDSKSWEWSSAHLCHHFISQITTDKNELSALIKSHFLPCHQIIQWIHPKNNVRFSLWASYHSGCWLEANTTPWPLWSQSSTFFTKRLCICTFGISIWLQCLFGSIQNWFKSLKIRMPFMQWKFLQQNSNCNLSHGHSRSSPLFCRRALKVDLKSGK